MVETVDERLLRALGCTRNKAFHALDRALKNKGITGAQFAVLEMISHNEAPMRVGELADNVLGSTGNIPLVVRNLEKIGYVETRHGESDRRVRIVDITETGRAVVEDMTAMHREWLVCLFAGLDEGMKNDLADLLDKMSESIDEALLNGVSCEGK